VRLRLPDFFLQEPSFFTPQGHSLVLLTLRDLRFPERERLGYFLHFLDPIFLPYLQRDLRERLRYLRGELREPFLDLRFPERERLGPGFLEHFPSKRRFLPDGHLRERDLGIFII
jgi:hypothetical protein